MVCVAITRGGYGEAWLFESFEEADLHPLIQYGDAIISGPEKVLLQYNLLDFYKLLDIIGDGDLKEDVLHDLSTTGDSVMRMRRAVGHSEKIFSALVRAAKPVLNDPDEICRKVRSDRISYQEERDIMSKEKKKKKTDPKTAPDNDQRKAGRSPAFKEDNIITLLVDKEGNKYGAANNPKRKGSKSAERFALYKTGMTVKKFLDAGGTGADLKWDTEKNFIKIAA